jgi:hypothetical protein
LPFANVPIVGERGCNINRLRHTGQYDLVAVELARVRTIAHANSQLNFIGITEAGALDVKLV